MLPRWVPLVATVATVVAAAIWWTLGRPSSPRAPQPAVEVAPAGWRARWQALGLPAEATQAPDSDPPWASRPETDDIAALQQRWGSWITAGRVAAVDPRRRRSTPVQHAEQLATALSRGERLALHPIEAGWLLAGLAAHVGEVTFLRGDDGVPSPLLLSRTHIGVRVSGSVLWPFRDLGAGTTIDATEAAALWLVVRAHASRVAGDDQATHRDLSAAERLVPGLPAAAFARGVLQIERGLIERGIDTCQAALARQDDPMARLFLADVLHAAEQPFKAFDMVEAVVARWPKLAEAHVARGILRGARLASVPESQRPALRAEAEQSFREALSLDAKVAGAAVGLAQLDLQAENVAAAIARLADAVTATGELEAGLMLAELQLQQGAADQALKTLARVRADDEERWWLLQIRVLAMSGAMDDAMSAAQEASGRLPRARQLGVLYAQLLRRAGKLAAAEAALAALPAGDGEDDIELAAMRAELALQAGRPADALKWIGPARAAAPRDKAIATLWLMALTADGNMGRRDEALAALVRDAIVSHEELAMTWIEAGDAEAAAGVLRHAVASLAPAEEPCRRAASLLAMIEVAAGRKDAAVALKQRMVERAGGSAEAAGKAMAAALDEAIAGAEAEMRAPPSPSAP